MKAESESGDPRRGLQRPRCGGVSAHVPEPPGQGAGPGAAERRGVGPHGSDLRTLRKAPSLLSGLSEEKTPPSVPSPAAWGRHFPSQTLVEPSWSQAGISPLGSPCRPTLCRPQNLGFSVYFLIRMPAMREPPGGPSVGVGALGRVLSTLFWPHLHRGGRASQGRRVPQSRHYGSLTIRMWHFFVVVYKLHRLPLAHTPTPPASSPLIPRRQEHIYFWSEKIILPEKGKSWRRF